MLTATPWEKLQCDKLSDVITRQMVRGRMGRWHGCCWREERLCRDIRTGASSLRLSFRGR